MDKTKYQYDFVTQSEMLEKLQKYAKNPDDDNIRIKDQIRDILLHTPELLYALHNEELEPELFDEDGNLNVDENGEPLGDWSAYFGSSSNIRPYIFIPETQTDVKHYVCYQTSTNELVGHNNKEKVMLVTFTIFIHGSDPEDIYTGIPRHDLIASIIREKFAWIGLEISNPVPTNNRETITDNNYIVRTLSYEIILPNSLVKTSGVNTHFNNKRW